MSLLQSSGDPESTDCFAVPSVSICHSSRRSKMSKKKQWELGSTWPTSTSTPGFCQVAWASEKKGKQTKLLQRARTWMKWYHFHQCCSYAKARCNLATSTICISSGLSNSPSLSMTSSPPGKRGRKSVAWRDSGLNSGGGKLSEVEARFVKSC